MNVSPPPGQVLGLVTSDQQGPWLAVSQEGTFVSMTPPVAVRCSTTVHWA